MRASGAPSQARVSLSRPFPLPIIPQPPLSIIPHTHHPLLTKPNPALPLTLYLTHTYKTNHKVPKASKHNTHILLTRVSNLTRIRPGLLLRHAGAVFEFHAVVVFYLGERPETLLRTSNDTCGEILIYIVMYIRILLY